jgi:hypothetical protein
LTPLAFKKEGGKGGIDHVCRGRLSSENLNRRTVIDEHFQLDVLFTVSARLRKDQQNSRTRFKAGVATRRGPGKYQKCTGPVIHGGRAVNYRAHAWRGPPSQDLYRVSGSGSRDGSSLAFGKVAPRDRDVSEEAGKETNCMPCRTCAIERAQRRRQQQAMAPLAPSAAQRSAARAA